INQLHLFTVMTLTGKVQLIEKDGDKQVVVQEGKPLKTESCTDTERKKIQDQIMAYVNAAATPPPPDKRAEPTPASRKKWRRGGAVPGFRGRPLTCRPSGHPRLGLLRPPAIAL